MQKSLDARPTPDDQTPSHAAKGAQNHMSSPFGDEEDHIRNEIQALKVELADLRQAFQLHKDEVASTITGLDTRVTNDVAGLAMDVRMAQEEQAKWPGHHNDKVCNHGHNHHQDFSWRQHNLNHRKAGIRVFDCPFCQGRRP